MGIGVLFFSVYLGMVFKETADTVKDARQLVQRNSREIEDIIRDASNILSAVSSVSSVVSSASTSTASAIATKAAVSVAKMRKKRKNK